MKHIGMTKTFGMAKARFFVLGAGVAAPLLMLSCLAVQAQEAPAAPAPSACSGIACIFGSRLGAAPQPAPAQPAPTGAIAQAPEAAPVDEAWAVKAKPHPVKPSVTIAATGAEVGRIKSLAAALPREKVTVVGTNGAPADFIVTAGLETPAGTEKARLFTEQMHIVAGATITSVADLKDKVVSFGPDAGPSQAAARKAFAALGVSVKETPLDLDNALDGVSTGDVAAVIVLAPQPLARLKSVSGLHFVAWPEGTALPAGAVASTIDGSAYPGFAKPGESIPAMGVDAVLSLSAKGAHKPAAKLFLTDLSQHAGALSRHGFDLIKADIETRSSRRVASAERR